MEIIEYEDKYLEDIRDLLVELEEYIISIDNNKVIGLIMGIVTTYREYDYLDYKCPKRGEITELVVSKDIRSKGVGEKLIKKLEEYFKSIHCEYVIVDVFGYNDLALKFYFKQGYHARMLTAIKKL